MRRNHLDRAGLSIASHEYVDRLRVGDQQLASLIPPTPEPLCVVAMKWLAMAANETIRSASHARIRRSPFLHSYPSLRP